MKMKPVHEIFMGLLATDPVTHWGTIVRAYAENATCPPKAIPNMIKTIDLARFRIPGSGSPAIREIFDTAITKLETQLADAEKAKAKKKAKMTTIEIIPAPGEYIKDWQLFGKWVKKNGGKYEEGLDAAEVSFT